MYFANVLLPGMFFDDIKKFGNLIFVEGDEKQKRLATVYNSLKNILGTAASTITTLGPDNKKPLDYEVEINGKALW